MRLPAGVIYLLLFSATAAAQQRADLHLFQYGLTTTEQRAALFEDFRYVLEEKMPRLSDELALGEAGEGGLVIVRWGLCWRGKKTRPAPGRGAGQGRFRAGP